MEEKGQRRESFSWRSLRLCEINSSSRPSVKREIEAGGITISWRRTRKGPPMTVRELSRAPTTSVTSFADLSRTLFRLVTGNGEVFRKIGKRIEHDLPGIILRQQHDRIPQALDDPLRRSICEHLRSSAVNFNLERCLPPDSAAASRAAEAVITAPASSMWRHERSVRHRPSSQHGRDPV